jgi:chromate transport protein ChrA
MAVALVAISVTGLCERFIAIRFYSLLLLLLFFFYYFSFIIIRSLLIIFRCGLKERKGKKKRQKETKVETNSNGVVSRRVCYIYTHVSNI